MSLIPLGDRYTLPFDGYPFRVMESLASRTVSYDVRIVRDEPDGLAPLFFFTSSHLNELSEPLQAWTRAQLLLRLLHGAVLLAYNDPVTQPRPTFPILRNLHDERSKETHRFSPSDRVEGISAFSTTSFDEAAPGFRFTLNNPIGAAIFLARKHRDVLILLNQLAEGLTYTTLYSVCDTLKFKECSGSAGFKVLIQEAGFSEADYRSFHHTANDFSVLGPRARHGLWDKDPPKSPYSLPDSVRLVLSVCRLYLKNKYGLNCGDFMPEPTSDTTDWDPNDF